MLKFKQCRPCSLRSLGHDVDDPHFDERISHASSHLLFNLDKIQVQDLEQRGLVSTMRCICHGYTTQCLNWFVLTPAGVIEGEYLSYERAAIAAAAQMDFDSVDSAVNNAQSIADKHSQYTERVLALRLLTMHMRKERKVRDELE